MFIAMATAICSLGHRLHTFTAVPRSTQICMMHPSGVAKLSTSFGWGKSGMWLVAL